MAIVINKEYIQLCVFFSHHNQYLTNSSNLIKFAITISIYVYFLVPVLFLEFNMTRLYDTSPIMMLQALLLAGQLRLKVVY